MRMASYEGAHRSDLIDEEDGSPNYDANKYYPINTALFPNSAGVSILLCGWPRTLPGKLASAIFL
jgi:hypothetical protein